jgi:hypothetical protein
MPFSYYFAPRCLHFSSGTALMMIIAAYWVYMCDTRYYTTDARNQQQIIQTADKVFLVAGQAINLQQRGMFGTSR